MSRTTEQLLQELIDLQKNKSGSGPKGSFSPVSAAGIAETIKSGIGTGFSTLKEQVTTNIEVWRTLSKVGANFSNDVIRMSTAAAEARVSLSEFAGIIDRNAKSFAGLGGSVTRGVEAFAKLTKNFQDNDISRQMMQLGYTSTEANELLALQVGFMRTKFSMDKDMQANEFAAVQSLATEMDLLSKITGQTRAEQESALKKAKDDAAIEAKFKLIGIREGADAEKAARQKFAEQYMQAEARGQGQVFKDFFLTGTVRSKEAAMQLAVSGQAGIETGKAATALAKGNVKLAEEYNKAATGSMVALQKNTAYLELVTRSSSEIGGAVSNAAGNLAKVNEPLVDSVNQVIGENSRLGTAQKSYREILEQIRADAKKSQFGERRDEKTGEYTQVSAATRAIIDSQKFYQDLSAATATTLEAAFREPVEIMASQISKSIADLQNSYGGGNIRQSVEEGVVAGLTSQGKEGGFLGKIVYETQQLAITSSTAISDGLGSLTNFLKSGDAKVTVVGVELKAGGGFVSKPEITLIGEEGPEWVLNKEQMSSTLIGAANSAAEQIAGAITNPKLGLSSINQDIKTTFSSVSGGGSVTRRQGQSEDSKAAEKELALYKTNLEEERRELAAKFKELMPDFSARDRLKAMSTGDESKALTARYDAIFQSLEKKVRDGITWETARQEDKVVAPRKEEKKETPVVAPRKEETLQSSINETIRGLAKSNNITDINKIQTGQKIKLPDGSDYVVKKGDTLSKIAQDAIKDMKSKVATPRDTAKLQTQQATQEAGKVTDSTTENKERQNRATAKENRPITTADQTSYQQGKSTLDDVVKSLDMLNKMMSQLISVNESLGKQQIKAFKANSANLYERY